MLQQKLGSVVDLQNQADSASQAVATGQSSDLAGATVAVEKASIAVDLVSSIRNKAVDAYQEIMRMQV
jgi:flagellar hook-basal body complex protein FliE